MKNVIKGSFWTDLSKPYTHFESQVASIQTSDAILWIIEEMNNKKTLKRIEFVIKTESWIVRFHADIWISINEWSAIRNETDTIINIGLEELFFWDSSNEEDMEQSNLRNYIIQNFLLWDETGLRKWNMDWDLVCKGLQMIPKGDISRTGKYLAKTKPLAHVEKVW